MDDANIFYGYCDELYECAEMSEDNKIRYLAGAFAPNGRNGRNGIAFYKLSNDLWQSPLMYVIPDLEDSENGSWAAQTLFGSFAPQGKAKVIVEEIPYSEDDEDRIKAQFEKVDKEGIANSELLDQVQCCIDIVVNAK